MVEIKKYINLEIKKGENSEIEIRAVIPETVILEYRNRAIGNISKSLKIDGFREGRAPESVIINKIGEQALFEEQAQIALTDIYPIIVEDEKLNVVGQPEVVITKLAPQNPVEFKIKTAIMPEITLPDYKKIAKGIAPEENVINITDKELEQTIEQIKKGIENHKKNDSKEQKETELTDESVKTLGNFKDLADFKTKIKENLAREKQMKIKEKRRVKIIEEIIKETKIDLPKIFVKSELDKILAQLKDDIARMNIKFNEYLEKINKTEEKLREEWKVDAEKRAKLQIILNEIARKENIKVQEEDIKRETDHILEHYKDAKPENARIYIESVLTNEKVFQFLEN